MAFEVEIFNYKTIKHVKFTIEGYTLLVGRNFIGKSAAIHAIVAALRNAEGDGFIRHGEKYCEVRIASGENSIIWHKEKGNNFYVIQYEGKLYDPKKTGRGEVPQPIIDMGFGPLTVANEKAYLWYARQFETLFLINRPRQNFTTDLIASITGLDTIYKASDMAKKDLSAAKSTCKLRISDLKDVREEVKKYRALEDYEANEQGMLDQIAEYQNLQSLLEVLEKVDLEYRESAFLVQKYVPVQKLDKVDPSEVDSLFKELSQLELLSRELEESSKLVEKYTPVNSIVMKVSPMALLQDSLNLINEINKIGALQLEYESAMDQLNGAKKGEGLLDLKEEVLSLEESMNSLIQVSSLHKDFVTASNSYSKVSAISSELKEIILPEEDIQALQEVISLEESVQSASREYREIAESLATINKSVAEVDKLLGEFKSCPLCGGDLCKH
jgi:predicted MPP superfamily phosphohydrolase